MVFGCYQGWGRKPGKRTKENVPYITLSGDTVGGSTIAGQNPYIFIGISIMMLKNNVNS